MNKDKTMKRRTFIKKSSVVLGTMAVSSFSGNIDAKQENDFPLTDLHVHLTRQFTIEHVMDIANKRGVRFGIVEHPGTWAIKNDDDLKKYIDGLRQYPVYIGLQPTYLGWSKNFSPDLLAQLDYILMDP